MTALLRKSYVAVEVSGELVLLGVGGFKVSLEFQPALELAAALRSEAAVAKRIAGDDASRKNVLGVLTNATPEKQPVSRFRKELPARLAARDLAVRHAGTNVEIHFGRQVMTLGYRDAMRVAQWLRVRGKQARNAAGERTHWAQLASGASLVRA